MMEDVPTRSSLFSPCGRQLSARAPPRRAAGKTCCTRFSSLRPPPPVKPLLWSSFGRDFQGRTVVLREGRGKPATSARQSVPVQVVSSDPKMSLGITKAMKWWEKGVQPNMKDIRSAQDLVDSLQNAGNQLVIVQFFSPGCAGCRALHPKCCQFAEMNPDVLFLQINYEEHKSMCYSLHVHVLPFFRFYRGAQGRLCSFSCTNATIKKFKDALAKHSTDRCSLGPARGLEESELLALAANKDLSFTHTKRPEPEPVAEPIYAPERLPPVPKLSFSPAPQAAQDAEGRNVVAAGR